MLSAELAGDLISGARLAFGGCPALQNRDRPVVGGQPRRVYTSADVQNAHRRAAIAISLRHSGHFFVVGSGGASPRFRRALIALTGTTMAKYTAAAISTNEMTALRKSPIRNSLPLILRTRAEKSGL